MAVNDKDDISTAQSPTEALQAMQLSFLLYGLQSPINIGKIMRLAESFAFRVHIFDPFGVFTNSANVRTIRDFSCGAYQREIYSLVQETGLHALIHQKRTILTSIQPDAAPITRFSFQAGDIIVLGNEYDGIDPAFTPAGSQAINIPMPDIPAPKLQSHVSIDPSRQRLPGNPGTPNMNVAMTAGIIAHKAFEQCF